MRCYSELQNSNLPQTCFWGPDKLVRRPTQPNLVSPPRSRCTAGSLLLLHIPNAKYSLASEEGSMLLYAGGQIRFVSRQPAVDGIGWPTECIWLANKLVPNQFHLLSPSFCSSMTGRERQRRTMTEGGLYTTKADQVVSPEKGERPTQTSRLTSIPFSCVEYQETSQPYPSTSSHPPK